MNIENFCEFVKGIHADPFKLVKNLTLREYYALKDHIQMCNKCTQLLDDVNEKYRDYKPDPNFNDGRFN